MLIIKGCLLSRVYGITVNTPRQHLPIVNVQYVCPQDPSYQFKDIKHLIMGMLDTYNYEEVLMLGVEVEINTTNVVVDVFMRQI